MHTTKNKPSKCVMARLMRKGVNHQKNFTLAQYGTWAKAEAAAQRWVKAQKKKLPPVESGKGRMTTRNEAGFVGVYAQLNKNGHNKNFSEDIRWSARWPECPNRGGISFSARKYGDQDAFLCAWLARKHETVDREWIFNRLKTFKKTKKCSEILRQKQVEFV
jgi:hypothetical protein